MNLWKCVVESKNMVEYFIIFLKKKKYFADKLPHDGFQYVKCVNKKIITLSLFRQIQFPRVAFSCSKVIYSWSKQKSVKRMHCAEEAEEKSFFLKNDLSHWQPDPVICLPVNREMSALCCWKMCMITSEVWILCLLKREGVTCDKCLWDQPLKSVNNKCTCPTQIRFAYDVFFSCCFSLFRIMHDFPTWEGRSLQEGCSVWSENLKSKSWRKMENWFYF